MRRITAFLFAVSVAVVSQGVTTGNASAGPWSEVANKRALGGKTWVSETPWSSATFKTGPDIALWYLTGPRGGIATVTFNGTKIRDIDMWSAKLGRKSLQLPKGERENLVTVTVRPERNTLSGGNRVNVDALSVKAGVCKKRCRRNPEMHNQTTGLVSDTGTWYPTAVPAYGSREWLVAVGSYVRGVDATPVDAARPIIREAACKTAREIPRGVIVLSFGKQVKGGANGFGKTTPREAIIQTALGWASGLAECGEGPWEVALGTSNSGGVTSYNGYNGGADWSRLVDETRARTDGRVKISGAVDLEPGWGPPGQARAWVDGFVAAGPENRLWNFGSADGCPQSYLSKLTCNNGWTVDDVIWVSSKAGANVVAMPQIHTQSGSQARQWAVLAARAVATGGVLRIASITVQTSACAQVSGGCPTTGVSAWDGWQQLRNYVDAQSRTAGMPIGAPMDIRWGWGAGFAVPQPTTTTTTTVPKTTTTTTVVTTTTPGSTTTVPGTTTTTTTTVPGATTTSSTSTTGP